MRPAVKAIETTFRNTSVLLCWTRRSDAFDDALRHLLGVAEQHHRSTIAVLKPSCAARIAVT
jgi:hypothetical protein